MILDRVVGRMTMIPGVRSLWVKFPIGDLSQRVHYGIFARPHYAYGVYAAAKLATQLGLREISVLEFGVAGGNGLLALETIAHEVARHFGLRITVVGFDNGQGLPTPTDYRDLPYVWDAGFYTMDEEKLRAALSPGTELIIGDVEETVPCWTATADVGPVGFVAFDLDYYSSTKKALRLFDGGNTHYLPRVYCYFDDTIWPEHACYNEYTGELLAIKEFNHEHENKKICPVHLFHHTRHSPQGWHEQMYVHHDFQHPLYCRNVTPIGPESTQKPMS